MPTPVKDQLWRLISSLNKAEKRNFKLYATRAGSTKDSKFIQLFDLLDRQATNDDRAVMNRLGLTSGQYSNLKRHLYQQLLTSLRLIYINKEIDIELREQIDFSRILYGKGHFLDALRTLERAKAKAVEHNQDILHLEILEFQKLIEARHVTLSRQDGDKMDRLLDESARRSHNILSTSELFNLNIQIHGRYIERGHSRTPAEARENETFWREIQARHTTRETEANTFHEKINRFQSNMWYEYIQLNFGAALDAAANGKGLFATNRQVVIKDPDLYLRCRYYVNVFAYLTGDRKLVLREATELAAFMDNDQIKLNQNSRQIGSLYRYLAEYNAHFLHGRHEAAYALSRRISRQRAEGDFLPNDQRWGLLQYKAAAACFLNRHYDEALDHLNEIINLRGGILREDLLINTRLLHAICNFELGNVLLVDYHLTGISRLLRRSREGAEVHKIATAGLRRLLKVPARERGATFAAIYRELATVENAPFEQKALRYLDLRAWLGLHVGAAIPA